IVGLYSLVSFVVAERTHEIGLRVALGADTGAVVRLVMGYGARLAAAGLAIGGPAAVATARLVRALVYGGSPPCPLVFAGGTAAVLLVCTLACLAPALRAMRVDPLVALRQP